MKFVILFRDGITCCYSAPSIAAFDESGPIGGWHGCRTGQIDRTADLHARHQKGEAHSESGGIRYQPTRRPNDAKPTVSHAQT